MSNSGEPTGVRTHSGICSVKFGRLLMVLLLAYGYVPQVVWSQEESRASELARIRRFNFEASRYGVHRALSADARFQAGVQAGATPNRPLNGLPVLPNRSGQPTLLFRELIQRPSLRKDGVQSPLPDFSSNGKAGRSPRNVFSGQQIRSKTRRGAIDASAFVERLERQQQQGQTRSLVAEPNSPYYYRSSPNRSRSLLELCPSLMIPRSPLDPPAAPRPPLVGNENLSPGPIRPLD